jgi:hypothetical protein
MTEALETLYALRIIYFLSGNKKLHKQISKDIAALENEWMPL